MARRPEVVNTYRLQMHAGFTLQDAARAVPYLAALGVTHLYLSPITTAVPGSTHGYDVIDPTRLNPELGGEEGYRALVEAQHEHGLGQVLDIVPNHMGIAPGTGNAYWEDVLRHGPGSPHASMFDIDWDAADGRVVLPFLGDGLDAVLARGEIEVVPEPPEEAHVRYFDARFPLAPETLEGWRDGGGSASSVRALLDRQHYSLEFWRTGQRWLNYRRFFAIDTLIGIRAERGETFDLSHGLVLDLVRSGAVDGVRIDHPDGLLDPPGYLARLTRRLAENGAPEGYVVVEKILAPDEPLRENWPGHGTTGYEFMTAATRALVAPEAERTFTALYDEVCGEPQSWPAIEEACRADVVEGPLRGHLERLAAALFTAAADDPGGMGDVTPDAFTDALLRLLASFDRYRTYHAARDLDHAAPETVRRAHERAGGAEGVDRDALAHTARLLSAPPEGPVREAVMRLQQVMPAVQAKGLEDRAFYRYRRLLALNEVGGDPSLFGEPASAFLDRLARDAARWPRRMLATATHDHKRGEDVRMRLAALTEIPDGWASLVREVMADVEPLQQALPARVHPADVYLLLQTVVATLPAGMTEALEGGGSSYTERIVAYMQKALREAAERTDWVDGDETYEGAVATLAGPVLAEDSSPRAALEAFARRLAPLGAVNSLAQVALKVAAPGVTDTYQGCELWDLSLVDPDNRRPVDFRARAALLERLGPALDGDHDARASVFPGLLEDWPSGAVKAYVLARGLRVRRERPRLFVGARFDRLPVRGDEAKRVIAFARTSSEGATVLAVPRLSGALQRGGAFWAPRWGDTTVGLPPGPWRDAFTGAALAGGRTPVQEMLGAFPVALLLPE